MFLHSLTYCDRASGWTLERVNFQELVLFVGASGVGKTRILRALQTVRAIASGAPAARVIWDAEFTAEDGKRYRWQGDFADGVANERVAEGSTTLLARSLEQTSLAEKLVVNPPPNRSALGALRSEALLEPLRQAFLRIWQSGFAETSPHDIFAFDAFDPETFPNAFDSYAALKNAPEADDLSLAERLHFVYQKDKPLFRHITNEFAEIFPNVEQLRIEPFPPDDEASEKASGAGRAEPAAGLALPELQIKERGVGEWIPQRQISAGMLRAIAHLSEFALAPHGTTLVIDEFENSLGAQCIRPLTQTLLSAGKGLQRIVVTHHPYVINAVDMRSWKIVTRSGSVVRASDASAFGLGRSKHEAFLQLLNLPEYQQGVETE